jgi:hypothetical protein
MKSDLFLSAKISTFTLEEIRALQKRNTQKNPHPDSTFLRITSAMRMKTTITNKNNA